MASPSPVSKLIKTLLGRVAAGKRELNRRTGNPPNGDAFRFFVFLVACRRDNVTADAAGRIGIFPLDLPELLYDAADSG
jgi:hypothetical protein